MREKSARIPVPSSPCSLTAFARWMRVDEKAVRKARAAGRLSDQVVGRVKGRPVVLDPVKAKAEWAAHTRPRIDSRKPTPADEKPSELAIATLRERTARAEAFELETARKKGLLVSAVEVERRWATIGAQLRSGLLGLPTRARQRLPHLSAKDVLVLDRLVREVLEELADLGKRLAS
jgi:phage terminase Nu1 subunit (DNA packaging protein)